MFTRSWSVATFTFVLLSCGSETATSPVAPQDPLLQDGGSPRGQANLQVYGTDVVGCWANVSVMHEGVPIHDASVLVNGQEIPAVPWTADGLYSGPLQPELSAGQAVSLEVTSGRSTVTGSGTIPERPVLTSPPMAATLSPGQDIVVTWTIPAEPDYFVVSADWSCGTSCGTGVRFDAARSTRTFTIPASAVPADKDILLRVFAYNDGTLGGDYTPYDPYPGMNIRADSSGVTVSYSSSDALCQGAGYCMDVGASCLASCQCCTGLCLSGKCEWQAP